MRANTQRIFDLLSRGTFLSVDSVDPELKYLYNDIEDNLDDYQSYFSELGLRIDGGEGYFYFSRVKESKISIEQKLVSFAQWIDILDFLKTYDLNFTVGYQFRAAQILERINVDVELREKARKLFRKQNTNDDVIQKLVDALCGMKYIETVNEQDGTYKVTSAFRYVEELAEIITIHNEDNEVSE